MLMNKKELFSRKNKPILYNHYENAVNHLYNAGEAYHRYRNLFYKYKDKYKNNEHIYNYLKNIEAKFVQSFYEVAYLSASVIKSSHYRVDSQTISMIPVYTSRLIEGKAVFEQAIQFCDMLEREELCIRSK